MARVPLNETADIPEEHRWLFERMEQGMGVLNIFRAFSHSPVALRRFMSLGTYLLSDSKLDPGLRELAILRAGFLCRAPYEVGQHVAFARRAGLTDEQVRGCADPEAHAALFTPQQLAVLRFATEYTQDARVTDATFAAVRAFLSSQQLVELTLLTGYYNLVSRSLNTLEVDLDADAKALLESAGIVF